jgi:hypothetical protein
MIRVDAAKFVMHKLSPARVVHCLVKSDCDVVIRYC